MFNKIFIVEETDDVVSNILIVLRSSNQNLFLNNYAFELYLEQIIGSIRKPQKQNQYEKCASVSEARLGNNIISHAQVNQPTSRNPFEDESIEYDESKNPFAYDSSLNPFE